MNPLRSLVPAALIFVSLPVVANASNRIEIMAGAQPQLTVGSDGRVWLAYGRLAETPPATPGSSSAHQHKGHQPPVRSGEIFVSPSTDGGATFAPALLVANLPKLMLGNRRGPRIAAHGDRIAVTVISDELVSFASADGGRTWSGPTTINSVPSSAREGLHDLAAGPNGELFVTWLDLRNGAMELWGAASGDGGRTWGPNQPVYRSPDKSICECCHPTALFDRDGNLAVMWRNSIAGARDMWMAVRPQRASRFEAPQKLGAGTWQLNACPMDGGRLLALGGGKFGAVWQRAGDVFLTRAGEAEMKLGQGRQPVAAPGSGGKLLAVWQQGSDLVAQAGGPADAPRRLATDARFATLVPLASGSVLVAYESGPAKGATKVVVERL